MDYQLPITAAALTLNPPDTRDLGLIANAAAATEDWGLITDAPTTQLTFGLLGDSAYTSGLASWAMGRGYAMAAQSNSLALGSADPTLGYRRTLIAAKTSLSLAGTAALKAQRTMTAGSAAVSINWQRINTPCAYKVPGAPLEYVIGSGSAVIQRQARLTVATKAMTVTFPSVFLGLPPRDLYVDGADYGLVSGDTPLTQGHCLKAGAGDFVAQFTVPAFFLPASGAALQTGLADASPWCGRRIPAGTGSLSTAAAASLKEQRILRAAGGELAQAAGDGQCLHGYRVSCETGGFLGAVSADARVDHRLAAGAGSLTATFTPLEDVAFFLHPEAAGLQAGLTDSILRSGRRMPAGTSSLGTAAAAAGLCRQLSLQAGCGAFVEAAGTHRGLQGHRLQAQGAAFEGTFAAVGFHYNHVLGVGPASLLGEGAAALAAGRQLVAEPGSQQLAAAPITLWRGFGFRADSIALQAQASGQLRTTRRIQLDVGPVEGTAPAIQLRYSRTATAAAGELTSTAAAARLQAYRRFLPGIFEVQASARLAVFRSLQAQGQGAVTAGPEPILAYGRDCHGSSASLGLQLNPAVPTKVRPRRLITVN